MLNVGIHIPYIKSYGYEINHDFSTGCAMTIWFAISVVRGWYESVVPQFQLRKKWLNTWASERRLSNDIPITFVVKVMTVLTLDWFFQRGGTNKAVGIFRFGYGTNMAATHICGPIFLVVELSGSRLLFRMSTSCPSGSRKGACDQHRMFRCSKTRLLWKCRWRFPTCFNMWALQSKHRWRQKHLQS